MGIVPPMRPKAIRVRSLLLACALLCGLLFLATTPASAATNVLFNKTLSSGAVLDLTVKDYTLAIGAANVTTARLTAGNETLFMDPGDCKKFGPETLCYERRFSETQVRFSLKDQRAKMVVGLQLNKTGAIIYGDAVRLNLGFNNTGESETEGLSIVVPLHKNLTVTDIDGCAWNGTAILFKEELRADDGDTCTAYLRADGGFDLSLVSKTNYTTFSEKKSVTTKALALKSTIPFPCSVTVTPLTALEPQEPFLISLFVKNTDKTKNITLIRFEVEGQGIEFRAATQNVGVSSTGKRATYGRDVLEPSDNLTVSLSAVVPLINATGTFEATITYNTTDKKVRTFVKTFSYRTISRPFLLELSPSTEAFEALSSGEMDIYITNQYQYLTFKGYDTQAIASFSKTPIRTQVPYSRQRIVATIPYTMPETTSPLRATVSVSVEAQTDDGQTATVRQEFPIVISPLPGFIIQKRIVSRDEKEGITTIAVNITSPYTSTVTVALSEELPSGAFASGPTTKTLSIAPGKSEDAYTYQLIIKNQTNDSVIPTKAVYAYAGTERTLTASLTVPKMASALNPLPANTTSPLITPPPVNTTLPFPDDTLPPPTQPDTRMLIKVMGAAGALLLLLLAVIFRQWIHHVHTFTVRRKAILKQYQTLLDEALALRKRKEELSKEQVFLHHRMDVVEGHLQGYDRQLPDDLAKVEQERQRLLQLDLKTKEQHARLKESLAKFAEREQQVAAYEQEIGRMLRKMEEEEQVLKDDKTLLQQDVEALHHDQTTVTQELSENMKQQEILADRMASFKERHVSHLNSTISILRKRKEQVLSYHQQLEQEEAKFRGEFEKLEQDLARSKGDLLRAEKIYKEASLASKRNNATPANPDGKTS